MTRKKQHQPIRLNAVNVINDSRSEVIISASTMSTKVMESPGRLLNATEGHGRSQKVMEIDEEQQGCHVDSNVSDSHSNVSETPSELNHQTGALNRSIAEHVLGSSVGLAVRSNSEEDDKLSCSSGSSRGSNSSSNRDAKHDITTKEIPRRDTGRATSENTDATGRTKRSEKTEVSGKTEFWDRPEVVTTNDVQKFSDVSSLHSEQSQTFPSDHEDRHSTSPEPFPRYNGESHVIKLQSFVDSLSSAAKSGYSSRKRTFQNNLMPNSLNPIMRSEEAKSDSLMLSNSLSFRAGTHTRTNFRFPDSFVAESFKSESISAEEQPLDLSVKKNFHGRTSTSMVRNPDSVSSQSNTSLSKLQNTFGENSRIFSDFYAEGIKPKSFSIDSVLKGSKTPRLSGVHTSSLSERLTNISPSDHSSSKMTKRPPLGQLMYAYENKPKFETGDQSGSGFESHKEKRGKRTFLGKRTQKERGCDGFSDHRLAKSPDVERRLESVNQRDRTHTRSQSSSTKSSELVSQESPDSNQNLLPISGDEKKLYAYQRCSCGVTFGNLFELTVHVRDSGHTPEILRYDTAEDLPKLVRGQDVWISQGHEQAELILRCIQCHTSFRSLPELTVHMVQTKHYVNIVKSDGDFTDIGLKDSYKYWQDAARRSSSNSADPARELDSSGIEDGEEARRYDQENDDSSGSENPDCKEQFHRTCSPKNLIQAGKPTEPISNRMDTQEEQTNPINRFPTSTKLEKLESSSPVHNLACEIPTFFDSNSYRKLLGKVTGEMEFSDSFVGNRTGSKSPEAAKDKKKLQPSEMKFIPVDNSNFRKTHRGEKEEWNGKKFPTPDGGRNDGDMSSRKQRRNSKSSPKNGMMKRAKTDDLLASKGGAYSAGLLVEEKSSKKSDMPTSSDVKTDDDNDATKEKYLELVTPLPFSMDGASSLKAMESFIENSFSFIPRNPLVNASLPQYPSFAARCLSTSTVPSLEAILNRLSPRKDDHAIVKNQSPNLVERSSKKLRKVRRMEKKFHEKSNISTHQKLNASSLLVRESACQRSMDFCTDSNGESSPPRPNRNNGSLFTKDPCTSAKQCDVSVKLERENVESLKPSTQSYDDNVKMEPSEERPEERTKLDGHSLDGDTISKEIASRLMSTLLPANRESSKSAADADSSCANLPKHSLESDIKNRPKVGDRDEFDRSPSFENETSSNSVCHFQKQQQQQQQQQQHHARHLQLSRCQSPVYINDTMTTATRPSQQVH